MEKFKAIDRHGAELEFEMREVGIREINEADIHYRVAYSKALSAGIFPRDKMIQLMKDQEIWTEKDDEKLRGVTAEIVALETQFNEAEKNNNRDECINICEKLTKKRSEMWKIMSQQASPLTHSCEGYAEVVRAESLLAARVYINGKRYWQSYKDYIQERDENYKSNVPAKMLDLHSNTLKQERDKIIGQSLENKFLNKLRKSDSSQVTKKKVTKKKVTKKKANGKARS